MVEVEDLDPIPAPVEEEEEMTGQEVLAEAFLDQTRKAVERLLLPCATVIQLIPESLLVSCDTHGGLAPFQRFS
jgi:hypothetical protein